MALGGSEHVYVQNGAAAQKTTPRAVADINNFADAAAVQAADLTGVSQISVGGVNYIQDATSTNNDGYWQISSNDGVHFQRVTADFNIIDKIFADAYGGSGATLAQQIAAIRADATTPTNPTIRIRPESNGTYTERVDVDNFSGQIEFDDQCVFEQADDTRFMQGEVDGTVVALTADYIPGSRTLSVADITAAGGRIPEVGDIVILCTEALDPNQRNRVAGQIQYRFNWPLEVSSATATSITLSRPLKYVKGVSPTTEALIVDAFTTAMSARVLIPNTKERLIITGCPTFGAPETGAGGVWTGPLFRFYGQDRIEMEGPRIERGFGPGISLNATNRAWIRGGRFRNLENDTPNRHFGYGISDGGFGTIAENFTGQNNRHTFTTSSSALDDNETDNTFLYASCKSVDALVQNASSTGDFQDVGDFDTHHNAVGTIFKNIKSPGRHIQIRGRDVLLDNVEAAYVFIFTEFEDGDGESWNNSQLYPTTCEVRGGKFHRKDDGAPIRCQSAEMTLSGHIEARGTGVRMVENGNGVITITGSLDMATTTFEGTSTLDAPGVGETDAVLYTTNVNADWTQPVGVSIDYGASVKYNGEELTGSDASATVAIIEQPSTTTFDYAGTIDADLSTDFTHVITSEAGTVQAVQNGRILLSVDGGNVSDLTTGIATHPVQRILAKDGSAKFDNLERTGDLTSVWKENVLGVTVNGIGTTSADFVDTGIVIPGLPLKPLDEAGAAYQLTLQGERTTSAGEGRLAIFWNGSFLRTAIIPAGATSFDIDLNVFLTGMSAQDVVLDWRYDDGTGTWVADRTTGTDAESLRLATTGFVIEVRSAVGDNWSFSRGELKASAVFTGFTV